MHGKTKIAVVLAAASLTIVGCSRERVDNNEVSRTHTTSGSLPSDNQADNTKRNEVDRSGNTLTPLDQMNDQKDLDITQAIRKSVVDDSALSATAKNVKIITRGGNVTLRGPVQNAREHDAVLEKARQLAGNGQIDDQLEIKNP